MKYYTHTREREREIISIFLFWEFLHAVFTVLVHSGERSEGMSRSVGIAL